MRFYIGMPVYQSLVHAEVMQDVLDLAMEVKKRGDDMTIQLPSSPFLSLNRNLIMDKGLDYDWILMWDADIQVPTPEFLYKMVETAYKQDAVMVGLAVKLKGEDGDYAYGYKDGNGWRREKKALKSPKEVDVMGAGVTLIKSSWVKDKLEAPYYEFKDLKGPGIIPEDWNFCEKIKQKGGKIVVEPSIETIHYGIKGWHHAITT